MVRTESTRNASAAAQCRHCENNVAGACVGVAAEYNRRESTRNIKRARAHRWFVEPTVGAHTEPTGNHQYRKIRRQRVENAVRTARTLCQNAAAGAPRRCKMQPGNERQNEWGRKPSWKDTSEKTWWAPKSERQGDDMTPRWHAVPRARRRYMITAMSEMPTLRCDERRICYIIYAHYAMPLWDAVTMPRCAMRRVCLRDVMRFIRLRKESATTWCKSDDAMPRDDVCKRCWWAMREIARRDQPQHLLKMMQRCAMVCLRDADVCLCATAKTLLSDEDERASYYYDDDDMTWCYMLWLYDEHYYASWLRDERAMSDDMSDDAITDDAMTPWHVESYCAPLLRTILMPLLIELRLILLFTRALLSMSHADCLLRDIIYARATRCLLRQRAIRATMSYYARDYLCWICRVDAITRAIMNERALYARRASDAPKRDIICRRCWQRYERWCRTMPLYATERWHYIVYVYCLLLRWWAIITTPRRCANIIYFDLHYRHCLFMTLRWRYVGC